MFSLLFLNLELLQAIVHKPKGDEDKIKLTIKGKERTYYELDNDGLQYKGVGKQFEEGDSIRIGIYSRTIKAPTGKKYRNYGFTLQIGDGKLLKLKYKKQGSTVFSEERPGWNYTKSGVWYVYLPVKEKGYQIKVKPLKGNPVVYVRVTSHLLEKTGKYSGILRTVNRQDRWRIETKKEPNPSEDIVTTYWYPLKGENQQQFEITGPASVRVLTRIQFDDENTKENYHIRIREDGFDLGTFYFNSEKSDASYVAKTRTPVGKWRSTLLNIPVGKHFYTFTIPNIKDDRTKTIFIRLKEWEEE